MKKRKIKYTPPPEKLTFMQWVDKLLTVAIVVFGAFALFGYISSNRITEPTSIEEEASALFANANNGSNFSSSNILKDSAADKTTNKNLANNTKPQSTALPFFNIKEAQTYLDASAEKPLIMFVFASWCPYCKQMFPVLSTIADAQSDKYNFIAISVDKSNHAIENYMQEVQISPQMNTYKTVLLSNRQKLGNFLVKHNPKFNNGFPYLAIFWQKKALAEITGRQSHEDITKLLNQLDEHIK